MLQKEEVFNLESKLESLHVERANVVEAPKVLLGEGHT